MLHIHHYMLLMLLEKLSGNQAFVVEPFFQSRNASVYPGQNHTLICELRNPVGCPWFQNGTIVEVANRYHSSNGSNITLSSIEIVAYRVEDKGRWPCLGNFSGFEESVLSTLSSAVPPNLTTIVYNGEPLMARSATLRIPENAPCCVRLMCIARNANPAVKLHWELDGLPLAEQFSQSDRLTESGYYVTTLVFSGDLRQIAGSSNLSCIAQHDNYTLSTSIFVEWQKLCEWSIPALRIVLTVVVICFLAFTVVAFCVCLYVFSKTQCVKPSPLVQSSSVDNWTTNLSTKALLPEPPIINYDPDELKVFKNPSIVSGFYSGVYAALPDDNSSLHKKQQQQQL